MNKKYSANDEKILPCTGLSQFTIRKIYCIKTKINISKYIYVSTAFIMPHVDWT